MCDDFIFMNHFFSYLKGIISLTFNQKTYLNADKTKSLNYNKKQ